MAETRDRGLALTPDGVHACVDAGSSIKGLAYVVDARIEGRPARLLLDTGAQRTDLLAESDIGRNLVKRAVTNRETLFGASGAIHSRTLRGAAVDVGAWGVTSDVEIVPGSGDERCPRDGAVSMDVLSRCVLVLSDATAYGRCEEAKPPSHKPKAR